LVLALQMMQWLSKVARRLAGWPAGVANSQITPIA
jgi:hypothetical protein